MRIHHDDAGRDAIRRLLYGSDFDFGGFCGADRYDDVTTDATFMMNIISSACTQEIGLGRGHGLLFRLRRQDLANGAIFGHGKKARRLLRCSPFISAHDSAYRHFSMPEKCRRPRRQRHRSRSRDSRAGDWATREKTPRLLPPRCWRDAGTPNAMVRCATTEPSTQAHTAHTRDASPLVPYGLGRCYQHYQHNTQRWRRCRARVARHDIAGATMQRKKSSPRRYFSLYWPRRLATYTGLA